MSDQSTIYETFMRLLIAEEANVKVFVNGLALIGCLAFAAITQVSYPQVGAANWSNGYLPAFYQGTPLRPKRSPILDLQPPPGVTPLRQRANLDLLQRINAEHAEQHANHDDLQARIASYELAFRMQTEVPDAIDLGDEDERTDVLPRRTLQTIKSIRRQSHRGLDRLIISFSFALARHYPASFASLL